MITRGYCNIQDLSPCVLSMFMKGLLILPLRFATLVGSWRVEAISRALIQGQEGMPTTDLLELLRCFVGEY